ncbi:CBL-interacting serine/threonine-protein kinase 6 [Tritrichomonas foetus]|uniref:CBL-interacting serine/threonine-protein kinase 6 n=1 Tax=Tritrichomonas foetus TaxID=1144522 RepID=A0A1J4IZU5_9EUKA|nr:CBL-interacting serine/threonine-protein kinase 6 [Tritrichomonas foetus]|eukprot:OHS92872.1 CBL-interacting serine/threonine-protein kinase 6 [Tritrichomonas foetus]
MLSELRKLNSFSSMIRYVCTKELGHGAFSTVYKCHRADTGESFAIKVFPKSNLKKSDDKKRFQRELNTMAFIHHENIISLHDCFSDDDNFYLVMTLCKNGELADYIARNSKLQEDIALHIFKQILAAISTLHSYNIVHRDLKPQNILFTEFPNIKVGNFGLSDSTANKKTIHNFCGSICFCSPECLSRMEYDPIKSDIWSLGVILYNMVVGVHPWGTKSDTVMIRNIKRAYYNIPKFVSKDCADLISRMMKLNPEDRITMSEISKHPWIKGEFHKVEPNIIRSLDEFIHFDITDTDSDIYSPFNEPMHSESKIVSFEGVIHSSPSFSSTPKKLKFPNANKRRKTEPETYYHPVHRAFT